MRRLYLVFMLVLFLVACSPQGTPTVTESDSDAAAEPVPTSAPAEAEPLVEDEPAEAEPTSDAEAPAAEEPTAETEAPAATEAPESDETALADRLMVAIRLRDQDMQQLDPAFLSRSGDAWVAFNVYSRLVRWELGTANIEPDLAESWEVSDDGLELTFQLRQGVMWHKGYGEVTSEDVKFSFERIMDANTGSPFNEMFSIVNRIEAPDPYTVQVFFNQPSATFLSDSLPWYPGLIVSKAAVEEMGADAHALNPIGSGPFIFESWTPGSEVVILANDEYYEGPPRIAGLRMLPIIDESAAVIALQSGDIMLAWLSTSESYEILQQDPDIELILDPINAGRYLWLNTRKAPTDDVLVRQALAHAIDVNAISEFGFGGLHPALMTIFPLRMLCYDDSVPTYEYNPELAREMLAEAGYPDGFTLTLLYSQRDIDQTISETVQEMWREVGVTLEITGLEHGTYTDIRRSPTERENYDIILTHDARTADPDSFLIETLHSGAFPPGSNASYYDQIDDLIDAGRTELDPEARCEIYREVQQKIQEDMPAIPIVNTTFLYAVDSRLKGVVSGSNTEFWAYPFYVEEE